MAPTIELSPDECFQFEILRTLSHARYGGSDIGEVLQAAAVIKPGDFESWYDTFNKLALHINGQADRIDASKNVVSARDTYLRASTYFRAADFFLHGRPDDPRINKLWDQQISAFDKAIALLPVPGERLVLKGDGFDIPAIYYRPWPADDTPKPTIILGNGFDGAQEEMLHTFGLAGLERGFNVITYEGPGQPTVRRQQGHGWIHDWEKVVTPVVDYLVTRPEVNPKRVALLGWSMGGYLAVRAAAFEHRLAAVAAVDGVYEVNPTFFLMTPAPVKAAYDAGDHKHGDEMMVQALASHKLPTTVRWALEHGIWSFAVDSASGLLTKTKAMSLKGITDSVQCPVLVAEGSDDQFFPNQPRMVTEALGDKATYVLMTDEDAASPHCHVGAMAFSNQNIFDWLENALS